MSADAHHLTAPPADGDGVARAMRAALDDAGLAPDEVQYINAHATSTPLGDIAEATAIARVFGGDAAGVAVSSTKSMTGHLLGGAGALEAGVTVLALRDQIAPPTINLDRAGCRQPARSRAAPRQADRDGARDDELLRLRRHQRVADLQASDVVITLNSD